MALQLQRVRIFSYKQELLSLALPFLFFGFLMIGLWNKTSLVPANGTAIYIFLAIFGAGHTCFTYLFLALIPEGRRLVREVLIKSHFRFFLILGLALLLLAYFVLSDSQIFTDHLMMSVAKFLVLLLVGQHILGQMRGFSSIYNHQLYQQVEFSAADRARAGQLETIERFLQNIILIVWLLHSVVDSFSAEIFKEGQPLGDLIPEGGYLLSRLTMFALFALAGSLVALSFLFPHAARSNKRFYMWRLFFFPLTALTPFAGFSLFVMHGVEYEQLLFKMLRTSVEPPTRRALLVCSTILFALFPLIYFMGDINKIVALPANGVLAALVFVHLVDHLHYFLDMQIFKMRNPEIRKLFAPLIFKN